MPLASSLIKGEGHVSKNLLTKALNKHAGPEEYAVLTTRFKKLKKNQNIKNKVYIRCDREEKPDLNDKSFKKRLHYFFKRNDYSFNAVIKLNIVNNY